MEKPIKGETTYTKPFARDFICVAVICFFGSSFFTIKGDYPEGLTAGFVIMCFIVWAFRESSRKHYEDCMKKEQQCTLAKLGL